VAEEIDKKMNKEIIKIEDLKREFTMGDETVRALKGISFTIKEG
jgi:putative ABC transport system ATP-binding protein